MQPMLPSPETPPSGSNLSGTPERPNAAGDVIPTPAPETSPVEATSHPQPFPDAVRATSAAPARTAADDATRLQSIAAANFGAEALPVPSVQPDQSTLGVAPAMPQAASVAWNSLAPQSNAPNTAPPSPVAAAVEPAASASPFPAWQELSTAARPNVAMPPAPPVNAVAASIPFNVAVTKEPVSAAPPRGVATNPLQTMLLGGVLACGLVGFGMFMGSRGSTNLDPIQQIGGKSWGGVNADSGNAIVDAVRRVGPAVMNVDTEFGKGNDDAQFLPDMGMGQQPRKGKGTGVVIDSKRGLMLTNAHVVAGAQKIQVTDRNNKKFTGRLIGSDRMNDIALVELSNKNLPEAKLAGFQKSDELKIGEWAIAIGNPFAQENTVTVGVVSAVGRRVGPAPMPGGRPGDILELTDMIQTDAAINPGNSGGPLCNIKGEVIGINTAILPMGQGLGFTIPINKAKSVADSLLKNGGKVPYIGIRMEPVTDAIKTEFGLKDKLGVLVRATEPGSPAAQAKLEPGDVIRAIDGKAIKAAENIQELVRTKKVGDILKVDILRNSSVKRTLTLKIGSRPQQ